MSDSTISKGILEDDSTILEGVGGYYGRTLDGKRARPPITGLYDALRPVLDKLSTANGLSRALQEATIIGIVERHLFGEGFDRKEFWERPGYPNVSTYRKWRAADPQARTPGSFVSVLEEAKTAGLKWRSQQASKRVEMAHDMLQHFAPELVEALLNVALDSRNDFAKLQAAMAGLDRVSERTAPKGGTAVNITGLESAIDKIYGRGRDAADDETAEDTA